MVEVFKTNVKEPADAGRLLEYLHQYLADHKANFDLEDCDSILRVECFTENIESHLVIDLVKSSGFSAEVLEG